VFIGTYEHALDGKGRVSMPGRFREVLGADQQLVIATNLDPGCRCLVAYPMPEWNAFVDRLASDADLDQNAIRLNRLVMASAVVCPIDRQGRVLIPATLREYAGLGRDLLWAGVGRKCEIWDKAKFAAEHERARVELPEITRALQGRKG
jgi:MraZ protein